MTNLNKIIKTVCKAGAITLQGIYNENPDIKPTVIRGTINRYVRNNKDKVFDRGRRGVYVSLVQEDTTVISLDSNKMQLKRALINKLKSQVEKIKLKNSLKVVGLNDYDLPNAEVEPLTLGQVTETVNYVSEDDSLVRLNNYPTLCSEKEDISKFINKIFNEDSRDFLKKLPDDSVDLVITDPPYKTTKRGIGKRTNTGGMMRTELTSKGKIFKYNDIEPHEYIPELFRVLKEGTHCYIMTNHINLNTILNTAIDSGFKFVKSLIWDKVNKIMGQFYMSQFEYILFFRKGKAKRINNCGTSDIIRVPNKKTKDSEGKNLHDTEKPVELAETLLLNSTQEGEVTLDPFSGLGFVPKASKKNKRFFIGNEIDPIYWKLSVDGLSSY